MGIDLQGLVKSRHDRVVAAEPLDDGGAVLYIREKGGVTERRVEFQPFVLLANTVLLNGCGAKFELVRLDGDGAFTCLAKFPDAASLDDALKHLRKTTGFTPSAPNAPYKAFSDACQQLMTSGGFRLFRGMSFGDVLRMQFDIETLRTPGFDFSNPEREADKIIIISMCDSSGWEKVMSLDKLPSEKALLEEFVRTVRERDPDILEGHNIFRFDLPYIEERAKRHKVRLLLGRDGSAAKKRNSRISIAERTINYTRFDTFGRHFVDTYFLTQLYDVSHRELEGYGLKHVAAHFGVAAEDRTYLDASDIQTHWDADRKRLLKYALDDARETRAISAILSPSYFCQAQLTPLKYQDCVTRGNATRIDAMLVAEYISRGRALPLPEPPRQFSGGLTKAFHAGVFENVWHCDVRSLYPSVILAEKLAPSRDSLGVFPAMLEKLREFRLEAKDAEKKARSREEKDNFNALQTSFKILITRSTGTSASPRARSTTTTWPRRSRRRAAKSSRPC